MATAGTGIDDAGIPAPIAMAGVGIGMCSGSSGCGVEPSLAGRLGADSCGSSLSSSDVSFRYEPGVRSCTETLDHSPKAPEDYMLTELHCTTAAISQTSIQKLATALRAISSLECYTKTFTDCYFFS